jgi:hypothetical protein
MFEYMVEAHCLGSSWGLALGFVGDRCFAQAARIVNVGRCLAGVMA